MEKEEKTKKSIDNLYQLNGRVPIGVAIPYGLQHVLAMFVSNLTPITIIAASSGNTISSADLGKMIQNAMFIAGLATLIQLYPLWRIGSGLPIVMGVSFTFVTILCTIAADHGYPAVIGAVIIGGLFEGTLGLLIRKISKLIPPIVCGTVVCGIGLSLFSVGIRAIGGGYSEDYGSSQNLVIALITLVFYLLWLIFSKGAARSLSVLAGLIVGYIVAACLGKVDLSGIMDNGVVSFPHFMLFTPEFSIGPIISVCIIFLVSATETMGDTSALASSGLGRSATDKEISGSIALDGFASSVSGLFGCPPVTSFSQNVGLVAMTKVVNRFTIMTGAALLLAAGFFPPLGNLLASLPQPVLGGCTIIMFGQILVTGMQMIAKCGFNQRNTIIVALSLAVGIGTTTAGESDIWSIFPQVIQDIFSSNVVAVVFVVALLLSIILPKNLEKA